MMKQPLSLLSLTLLLLCSISAFAGNKVEVIIPGNHTSRAFTMSSGLREGDYIPNTIIFKVKPQYRQNCKPNSVDNLLPLQDFLENYGAKNLNKIYPHQTVPEIERNALGQKLVDLSTLYSFKYTAAVPLEKIINGMLSLGYFEYVEPWYIPKTDFIPNDPSWTGVLQYHLQGAVTGSINTVQAWDVTTGNATVVIGIVDTGTETNHPDLTANLYHQPGEIPNNGIDDEGDGYIDNYNGWDLGDISVNSKGDNDVLWQGSAHGVLTSGDAAAVTNNNVGVASPGFNCKFFMTKVADAAGQLVAAYPGITYAADHGAKIISLSWGSASGGAYGQDIVNYAAINKNCLVLASAGNGYNKEQYLYPGSYNNVYRVAGSEETDAMADFSTDRKSVV